MTANMNCEYGFVSIMGEVQKFSSYLKGIQKKGEIKHEKS